mmetsp:Transcript_4988/g.7619  ORF Transcript_4988/g.7619 Transcript_4988/m.7619 type:complete len:345 (-) Transcript_4988:15-1049(-)
MSCRVLFVLGCCCLLIHGRCIFRSVKGGNLSSSMNVVPVSHQPWDKSYCFSYQSYSGDPVRNFCFPSVIVSGFPKCGSSFLFNVLSQHCMFAKTKRKELCLGGVKSETWQNMISYLPNIEQAKNKYVLSGCMHLGANTAAMKELCIRGTKLVYVVRDVADMLWASYNFWCIDSVDIDCFPGKHASPVDKRSPEHFHSMIINNTPMGGGVPLTQEGLCYRKELLLASQVFGASNILVIRSEDMLSLNSKKVALTRILRFFNVENNTCSMEWLHDHGSTMYRVNSGKLIQSRGEKTQTYDTSASGLYEISDFRPMFSETRALIYDRWADECRWLARKYGIVYDSCM